MGFEGIFGAVKDYLQPALQVLATTVLAAALATSLPVLDQLSTVRRTALAIGLVYFVLHLLSAAASRRAHHIATLFTKNAGAGSEDDSVPWLWATAAGVYILLGVAAWQRWTLAVVVAFVALHVLQNVWRPILISRFDSCSQAEEGATVLSIESQSKRAATMVAAPVLGGIVDWLAAGDTVVSNTVAFWPLGLAGALVALAFLRTTWR